MPERTIDPAQLASYTAHLRREERSPGTIEKYLRDVEAFFSFVGGDAVTKETAIQYKEHLKKKYKPASVNSMLAAVNRFFREMGWFGCIVKALKIQREAFRSKERELSKEEYFRLLEAAKENGNTRLYLLMQTLCATGIRVSELQAAKCGEAVVHCKGKTRTVFIIRELRKKLLRYATKQNIQSGMIFITRTGKPISRTNIWREMKALCVEAEVNPQKVFPHNLRHLFARVFYGIEKDIAKLADILGHSSINTTRIYIISTGTEHRRRMENMHLIL